MKIIENMRNKSKLISEKMEEFLIRKEAGIDGILVTVGLCIIALVLCVVMKNSLTTFIQTIVTSMTAEAQKILSGATYIGVNTGWF